MRISDWSSDVCSSDLARALRRLRHRHGVGRPLPHHGRAGELRHPAGGQGSGEVRLRGHRTLPDRKSVVEGKSVAVSVDLGGRRISKKNNITNTPSKTHHLPTQQNVLLNVPKSW